MCAELEEDWLLGQEGMTTWGLTQPTGQKGRPGRKPGTQGCGMPWWLPANPIGEKRVT
jgi:hypothetical protein